MIEPSGLWNLSLSVKLKAWSLNLHYYWQIYILQLGSNDIENLNLKITDTIKRSIKIKQDNGNGD